MSTGTGLLPPFDTARARQFSDGEMILYEGDPSDSVYMIESGQVEVVLEDQEQGELILTFLQEGDIFGEMSFFSQDKQRCAMIRAVTDTKVRVCEKNKFLASAEKNRDLWMLLVEQLSNRLRSTNRRYSDRAFHNVKTRIAHILADLTKDKDAKEAGIHLNITRSDLGRIASCSREVAGQAVLDLAEDGLIATSGRSIQVKNLEKLKSY